MVWADNSPVPAEVVRGRREDLVDGSGPGVVLEEALGDERPEEAPVEAPVEGPERGGKLTGRQRPRDSQAGPASWRSGGSWAVEGATWRTPEEPRSLGAL